MALEREDVKAAVLEFVKVFGLPDHLKDPDALSFCVDVYHRELSKKFDKYSFEDALSIAWQQARRFPCISDFHRGFDAPETETIDVSYGLGGGK
jgi:hypothetical protein